MVSLTFSVSYCRIAAPLPTNSHSDEGLTLGPEFVGAWSALITVVSCNLKNTYKAQISI